jgi:hypothetical protein
VNSLCKICAKRRARRYCPGVSGEICPVCCGNEREVTIDCPLDCEYLRAARQHDPPVPVTEVPNRDVKITETFIREHEQLVTWMNLALVRAMEKERAVDMDAREAIDALIRTYRTRESGLIYETRPQNPYAAAIQDSLRMSIQELEKNIAQETGMHSLRDADVLGTLVFLQRMELQHSNGRRRGRAFFDVLRGYFPAGSAVETP